MKAVVPFAIISLFIPIISSQMMGKMLVATGDNGPFDDNTRKSEVIDLVDPTKKCQHLPDFPLTTSQGAGGLITNLANGRRALVCSGLFSPDCYIVGDEGDKVEASLKTQRSYVASVVLDNRIWITGKYLELH